MSSRSKLWSFTPLFVFVLVWIVAALSTHGFSAFELRDGRLFGPTVDVFVRGSKVMLVALGMTLVIAGGGVDLSVGSVMAIAAVVAAKFAADPASSAVSALGAGLVVGVAAGAINGALVVRAKLAPIVATLVLMTAGRGVAQLLADGKVVSFDRAGFASLASSSWFGLPAPIWLVAFVFAALVAAKRGFAFGLYLEASGDNRRAARLAGVPVERVLFATYVVSGICAGLAGMLDAADIRAADSSSCGLYLELDAILAVVLGGTPLEGGRARLLASLFGALTLQTVHTAFLMHGIGTPIALMVKALVVIAACAVQRPNWLASLGATPARSAA